MPKVKTVKAAAKRFKVSANGKVKYKQQGKRHNLGHRKSASRKLKLRQGAYLNPVCAHHVLDCLPYK